MENREILTLVSLSAMALASIAILVLSPPATAAEAAAGNGVSPGQVATAIDQPLRGD